MTTPLFGVGFRTRHRAALDAAPHAVDWLEVVSDGYLAAGGERARTLARLRADHPLALHGVGLAVAGTDPLDPDYLGALRRLAERIEPRWVSDHLCWTSLGGHASYDLLPVAYTEETLAHVAARVARAQDALGRRLLLENPSAYVAFRGADMDEATFLAALVARTGCGILLDVNNLHVNAVNLGVDPAGYLATLPPDTVGYMHLAGHTALADVCVDTHAAGVPASVWRLFEAAARRFPAADVIVERDDRLPPLAGLAAEAAEARRRHRAAVTGAPAGEPPSARGAAAGQARRARDGIADARDARPRSAKAPVEPAPRPHGRTPDAGRAPRAAAASAPTRPATGTPCPPRRWRALQRAFWQRLVDKPAGFDHRADRDLPRLLDDSRPVAAARGMRVYSDAYGATLRRALATNLPALASVLAPNDFAALAAAYLRRHPPHGTDAGRVGAHLPSFLHAHPLAHDYGVGRAVLAELAALEQAHVEVQDAPDAPAPGPGAAPVTPATLAALAPAAWPRLRLAFAPALQAVPAGHDVLAVIAAVERGVPPPRPAAGLGGYVVHRGASGVVTTPVGRPVAALVRALAAGRGFAAACRAADPDDPGAAAAASVPILMTLAAAGLIAAIDASTHPPRRPARGGGATAAARGASHRTRRRRARSGPARKETAACTPPSARA